MAPNPSRPGEGSRAGGSSTQNDADELPHIGPIASQGQLPPPHNAPTAAGHHLHPSAGQQHQTPFHTPMSARAPVASPMAAEAGNTEYFPSLGQAPSRSSLRSYVSDLESPALPRQPAIRIRRRGGSGASSRSAAEQAAAQVAAGDVDSSGRPRSISQPERTYQGPQSSNTAARHSRKVQPAMPRLTEEGNRPTMQELGIDGRDQPAPLSPTLSMPEQARTLEEGQQVPDQQPRNYGRIRRVSNFWRPRRTTVSSGTGTDLQSEPPATPQQPPARTQADDEYDAAIVDYLDTIDPEVQTLSALTNVQNSLFVPNLGSWLNRRPAYELTKPAPEAHIPPRPAHPPPPATQPPPIPEDEVADIEREKLGDDAASEIDKGPRPDLLRTSTITSQLTDSHYAALPHGQSLEGWTDYEKSVLDDHVRHMLHSRRAKFKRSMKGFGQYVRRPLGFLVTLYATLITLFGLAWVLFLIGWVGVSDNGRQDYLIHIIDSVLVALFAIMGDGLAPFRAVDTYHLAFVMHYARLIRKARKKREKQEKNMTEAREHLEKQTTPPEGQTTSDDVGTPSPNPLDSSIPSGTTENDDTDSRELRPEQTRRDSYTLANNIVDLEDARSGMDAYEGSALTPEQQKKLFHHQSKLARSHSFYRPNETETHYAFPLSYAIAIVLLLDLHSCLQISLGATTWGIDYKTRHKAITSVILAVSITVNVTAGIVISRGGKLTRKKDVWKLMNRQEITSDAIKHIQAKKEKAEAAGAPNLDHKKKTKKPLKVQLQKEDKARAEEGGHVGWA